MLVVAWQAASLSISLCREAALATQVQALVEACQFDHAVELAR